MKLFLVIIYYNFFFFIYQGLFSFQKVLTLTPSKWCGTSWRDVLPGKPRGQNRSCKSALCNFGGPKWLWRNAVPTLTMCTKLCQCVCWWRGMQPVMCQKNCSVKDREGKASGTSTTCWHQTRTFVQGPVTFFNRGCEIVYTVLVM